MGPTEWSKSPYLRYVIQESMRLIPTGAMGGGRITSQEFTVERENKSNLTIPKGSCVIYPFLILFRDPNIFKDPEIFGTLPI